MGRLSVYLSDGYAGILSYDRQQRFSFQYAPDWITRKYTPPLSLLMPVREEPYPDNADAHAKNISLLLMPNKIRLAPFYDLMCTGVYEGISEKLAMKIGGENRPQWIQSRHWERMAEAIGVSAKFVLRTGKEMAKRIGKAAEDVVTEQEAAYGPALIIKQIQNIIIKQGKLVESATS